MIDPVYILIRTSGRPVFFERMMETVKNQTYKNIVTIVHTDDPRDEYVAGDIVIRGKAYDPGYGNGTYNLYNNRLLQNIPDGDGWYHFIDDDDEYASDTVIEELVEKSKVDYVNVGRVMRWDETIWPRKWMYQNSFQTECFFMSTKYKLKAKWWGHKNGDHQYSKQLTKILSVNWIENLLICKAQEGKGHGKRLDKNSMRHNNDNVFDKEKKVVIVGIKTHKKGSRKEWVRIGEVKRIKYEKAVELEKIGVAKITYEGVKVNE